MPDGLHVVTRFYRPFGYVELQIDVPPDSETRGVFVHINDPGANICGYNDFRSVFCRDPDLESGYQIHLTGLVYVADLSLEYVLAVVGEILENGQLTDAFEPPDDEADCQG